MTLRIPPTVTEQMLNRICSEFAEMPGLRLTQRQAQRLWGLDADTCGMALAVLVEARFLRRIGTDAYARVTEGPVAFPCVRMVKAETPVRRTTGIKRTG